MLKSTQKIFETAKQCFFQHGYSASSIAMISRYSKVSRVTIHKQFSSKEDLFRAFIENFLLEKDTEIQAYINSPGMFWDDTSRFLAKRCTEVFDNIPSTIIKADLIHAGQTYCADLIDKNRVKTRHAIGVKLQQAIDQQQVCLAKIGLVVEDFAANIESVAESIMLSSAIQDSRQTLQKTLDVYKVASWVERS
ncbi:TetR/AcrR family transcriptional regulator [Paraglaciecola aquimarina]|uniref:TetR/AcrR family transcriptional regulator n=1 Tax=Paraglaciecola algarum TaxID=3050085 RepID=A0ABS9D4L6_9ALTE|nr:TetR/AcrR family transcriptional regulator [Paraglaciecola sp. G1-23]MCF2947387.1 TetR/AcrR family transcriptional regulator [Paraglaciecola sp. G1-23]